MAGDEQEVMAPAEQVHKVEPGEAAVADLSTYRMRGIRRIMGGRRGRRIFSEV